MSKAQKKWDILTYHLDKDGHVQRQFRFTLPQNNEKVSIRKKALPVKPYGLARRRHAMMRLQEGVIVNPEQVGVMEIETA